MTAASDVYIVDACRTPVGRFRGALSGVRPDDLLAGVLRALLDRNPTVPPDAIEDVVVGAANQAGEDNRNVARLAALLAGLPVSTPGGTVNRLCGSGLDAVIAAWRGLAVGDGDLAIAGGVESMSRAPFVLPKAEERLPRRQDIFDTTLGWRMVNPRFPGRWTISMGQTAEVLAEEFGIGREEQDAFAVASHRKAVAAQAAGAFVAEVVAVTVDEDTGRLVGVDEGPRGDTSLEALARLKPVFKPGGTVTAGNSSSFNDGAAAVLLATASAVDRLGLVPLARLVASAVAGVEPHRMGIGPAPAMDKALARAGWKLDDVDVVELNEAFAAQSLAVLRQLGLDPERVNPSGGAIALGHPLGCSGARILTTLVHGLRSQPAGSRGAATMCVGVGQGIACLVERA
jgi:3-oxoadipyl-CoA thiolase